MTRHGLGWGRAEAELGSAVGECSQNRAALGAPCQSSLVPVDFTHPGELQEATPELGFALWFQRSLEMRELTPWPFPPQLTVPCVPEAFYPSVPVSDSIQIGQLQFKEEDTEPWALTVITET